MSRPATAIVLTAEERQVLTQRVRATTSEQRMVVRARVIRSAAEGRSTDVINQIECWFSILSRRAWQSASFTSVQQLRDAIDPFITVYNAQATPSSGASAWSIPSVSSIVTPICAAKY